ncbi:PDZ domain-containing protein [bacterium]|jgi:predicted aspartyl protease|nr:PDZ domain-containing protein [bacterium]
MKTSLLARMSKILFLVVICFAIYGCTEFSALLLVNSGDINNKELINEYIYYEPVEPTHPLQHAIILNVKINDSKKNYRFILDTGALTVINKKIIKELNLKTEVTVSAWDANGVMKKTDLIKLVTISINDVVINNIAAGVIDLSKLEQTGLKIDGLIGSNALRFFKVTIDYEKNIVHLTNNKKIINTPLNGYKIKFEKDMLSSTPEFRCQINEELDADALIDTGFGGNVLIPYNFIKKLNYSETDKNLINAVGIIKQGIFSTQQDKNKFALSRINSLSISPESKPFKNSLVYFNTRNLPALKNIVLLGKDFLANFLVTIDYINNELILNPKNMPPNQKHKSNIFATGLAIQQNEKKEFMITGLWENSPAYKAGLLVGDQLIKINNSSMDTLSIDYIFKQLNDEKTKQILLTVKRDNKILEYNLKKEFLLPIL